MTSGTKQQRDPVTLLTICVLWLAMGVFVLYPIVRLLAMTFIVDGHLTLKTSCRSSPIGMTAEPLSTVLFWRAQSVLPARSSDSFLPSQ